MSMGLRLAALRAAGAPLLLYPCYLVFLKLPVLVCCDCHAEIGDCLLASLSCPVSISTRRSSNKVLSMVYNTLGDLSYSTFRALSSGNSSLVLFHRYYQERGIP